MQRREIDANRCLARVWWLWDHLLSRDVDLLSYCGLSISYVLATGLCDPAFCPGGAHRPGEGGKKLPYSGERNGYKVLQEHTGGKALTHQGRLLGGGGIELHLRKQLGF